MQLMGHDRVYWLRVVCLVLCLFAKDEVIYMFVIYIYICYKCHVVCTLHEKCSVSGACGARNRSLTATLESPLTHGVETSQNRTLLMRANAALASPFNPAS
jgi:hypothetical protein